MYAGIFTTLTNWYVFPLAGIFFCILAVLVFHRSLQRAVVQYVGIVAGVSTVFALGAIFIPSSYTAAHPYGHNPLAVYFRTNLFPVWLVVPFVSVCLSILSRFVPREQEAHGALLLFSIITLVVGVPIVTLISFVLTAIASI